MCGRLVSILKPTLFSLHSVSYFPCLIFAYDESWLMFMLSLGCWWIQVNHKLYLHVGFLDYMEPNQVSRLEWVLLRLV